MFLLSISILFPMPFLLLPVTLLLPLLPHSIFHSSISSLTPSPQPSPDTPPNSLPQSCRVAPSHSNPLSIFFPSLLGDGLRVVRSRYKLFQSWFSIVLANGSFFSFFILKLCFRRLSDGVRIQGRLRFGSFFRACS